MPECLEQEPNDSQETAQAVTLPVIVNGRIDHPGDWDVFRFEGRTGDPVVAEVYARRLDSPLDSVIKLTDVAGKQLAFNDDYEDKGSGLNTHHADSYFNTVLPANGTYYLWLGDTQHKGGPEYSYRLRLSPPQPDFALRVVPSSLNVRAGGSVPLTVYALRKDGFTNQITLVLDGAPAGFKLTGDFIPAGQNQVQVTLTAPPTALPEPVSLSLQGCAVFQGRALLRKAVPAEDMMQAFAYRHLVPVKELEVAVLKRPNPRATMTILSGTPVRMPPGGTARIEVGLPGPRIAERAQFELSNPPEGITIQKRITGPRRRGDCAANGCRQGQTRPQRKPDHQRLRATPGGNQRGQAEGKQQPTDAVGRFARHPLRNHSAALNHPHCLCALCAFLRQGTAHAE